MLAMAYCKRFIPVLSLALLATLLQPSWGIAQDKEPQKAEDKAPQETQLHLLRLSGNYVDLPQGLGLNPMSLLTGQSAKQKPFYRLCEHIDKLAEEKKFSVVVFDLSDESLSMNQAQLAELTRRLGQLKKADIQTFAWLENASNVHYGVAACCDKILLADFGGLDLPSMAMGTMFYRDLMDLVGVKASVVRAGDFKGAVEPYTNATMSSHLREHYLRMLKSMNDARIDRLARARGLSKTTLRELQATRMLTAKDAVQHGLVDRLAPFGSMRETIETMIDGPVKWVEPKKKKKEMSLMDLLSIMSGGDKKKPRKNKDDSIAVLHLSGAIVDGSSTQSGSIVSRPTAKEIDAILEDDSIKAVVVRVNSPGGSATASEVVRQALKKLSAKKPTVISMGEMAASGGYWISCIGVPIYAEQGTITGSIGVFSMKLSFGGLMRRAGVHLETIALDDSAGMFSMDDPWNENQQKTIGRMITETYDRFLGLVAKSRSMSVQDVQPLAGGRVWSGGQAKSLGLVDEIGGVDDCLAYLAREAKLDKYKVVHRPVDSGGLGLLDLLGGDDEDEILTGISWKLLRPVLARGFRLESTTTLIRESLNHQQGLPKMWLMHPAEIQLK